MVFGFLKKCSKKNWKDDSSSFQTVQPSGEMTSFSNGRKKSNNKRRRVFLLLLLRIDIRLRLVPCDIYFFFRGQLLKVVCTPVFISFIYSFCFVSFSRSLESRK